MKKVLFIVVALLVLVGVTDAQRKVLPNAGLTSGTSWWAYKIDNSQVDTSNAIKLTEYTQCELQIYTAESTAVTVYYQPQWKGAWGNRVAIGSAWTTTGADTKGFAIPAGALGCDAIRWSLVFSGSGNGVTNDTIWASTVLKK